MGLPIKEPSGDGGIARRGFWDQTVLPDALGFIFSPRIFPALFTRSFPNRLQALDEIPECKEHQSRNRQGECKLVKTKIRDDLQKESDHSQTDGDPKGGMFWRGEFYHGCPFRCEQAIADYATPLRSFPASPSLIIGSGFPSINSSAIKAIAANPARFHG